jgi:hypothetical protein
VNGRNVYLVQKEASSMTFVLLPGEQHVPDMRLFVQPGSQDKEDDDQNCSHRQRVRSVKEKYTLAAANQ